jgi:ribonucleoside-diphosphate reductase beta chain
MSLSKLSTDKLSKKYNLFPVNDEDAWKSYVKFEGNFWTALEMEYVKDIPDYNSLKVKDPSGKNAKKKKLIDMILGFFSPGDGLVIENLLKNFLFNSKNFEEYMFFIAQAHNEAIHAMTYGLIIHTLIPEQKEQKEILEMVDNLECTNKKAKLMEKYASGDYSITERYVAFAAAEGILFCVLFNIIYWFRSLGMFSNFIFTNEKIAQDESAHRNFGCNRFKKYRKDFPISDERVIEIIKEFVEVEKMFINVMLPEPIDDLNAPDLNKYLLTVGDNLLIELGLSKYFSTETYAPSFMGDINLENKPNFYEQRVGNYQRFNIEKALNVDNLTKPEKQLDAVDNLEEIEF